MRRVDFGGSGEGDRFTEPAPPPTPLLEPPRKSLTTEDISEGLQMVGKNATGLKYAYLMLTATNKHLTDVSLISKLVNLLYVDLSGNYLDLRSLTPVLSIPYLTYLNVENNRLESVALPTHRYLQVLNLDNNQIKEAKNISMPSLETLTLSQNVIYSVHLDQRLLPRLTELRLDQNRLTDTEGSYPRSLVKLSLSRNLIRKITDNISNLRNLNELDLSGNQIRKLDGFTNELSRLSTLNLKANRINKRRQFGKLRDLPELDALVMTDNPVLGKQERVKLAAEDDDDDYLSSLDIMPMSRLRLSLLVLLPKLKTVNDEPVTGDERDIAQEKRNELLKEIFDEESSEEEREADGASEQSSGMTEASGQVRTYLRRGEEEGEYYG